MSTVPIVRVNFGIFSARSKWFPVGRVWWPWTKPGYITITRRQKNNHWSGGKAVHTDPPQKIPSAKIHWKSSRLDFFGIKTASSSFIIFHRVKISTRSITHPCWCNWRTFWRKNAAGSSLRGACSCMTMPRLSGHLQRRSKWPTWALSWPPTLFSGSGPVGLPPVPWTEKTIECSPFFVRRRGHCCSGDLAGRTNYWFFFLGGLQMLEQRAKKSMLNKSRVWLL